MVLYHHKQKENLRFGGQDFQSGPNTLGLLGLCVCFDICLISVALIGLNTDTFNLSPCETGVAVRSVYTGFH